MEIPKTEYKEPVYQAPRRAMPKAISDRLKKLGLDRKPGETARDQALRCKAYLKSEGLFESLPDILKRE